MILNTLPPSSTLHSSSSRHKSHPVSKAFMTLPLFMLVIFTMLPTLTNAQSLRSGGGIFNKNCDCDVWPWGGGNVCNSFEWCNRNESNCEKCWSGKWLGPFQDINWNYFKALKQEMTLTRFRRKCDFDSVTIRRTSQNYAELVTGKNGSCSIGKIVGHTFDKNNYPFESPSITSSGQSGSGFAVESRGSPYSTAFGYRTEITLWEHDEAPVDQEKEYYYSFHFKLDQSFPVPSNFLIINQLHQMPGTYTNHSKGLKPPFSIRVTGSPGSNDLKCSIVLLSHPSTSVEWQHKYDIQYIKDCGILPRDDWLRVSVFLKPSPISAYGVVGVDIANISKGFSPISTTLYTGPVGFNNGEGIRNKIGVYSSAGNTAGSYKIIFDNVWVE